MAPAWIALGLLALAQPLHRTEGRVLQATATRVYLDAGADDGLAPAAEVIFHRAGAEVARCRLETVAARSSACGAHGVHPGDLFALPGRPTHEPPRLLAPLTAPEALQAQGAVLAAAPIPLVSFTPPERAAREARPGLVEVDLTEVAWFASGATSFTGTRAGINVRDLDVGLGMRLDVDAQAIRWSSRPSDPAPRFRPKDASQLYVWQASLSRDAWREGFTVSAGRVLPWRIPGATILDGATAGWRAGSWEVGGFAGLVPDPMTLGIATDRSTAGGYWGWEHAFSREVSLRDEGRLAVVRSPELGTRFEGETLAAARLGRALDLSGSIRVGVGGDVKVPGDLDAARLEAATRPVEHVRLAGWLAYDGLAPPKDTEPMVYPGHSRRAEASASWEQPNVRITALGGVAKDLSSGLDRSWVGPVLDLPRLLFGRGGVSLGYLEELGWSKGRSAWLQAIYRPWERLRLIARASWSHAADYALMQDEVGGTLGAAVDLGRIFSARLTMTGRMPIQGGEGGSTPSGGTVLATLAAQY
jgi:hypothetical protein